MVHVFNQMLNGIFVDVTILDEILLNEPEVFKQHEMEDQRTVAITGPTNTE